jgi:lipopolysaccharide transport system permease protein
VESAREIVIEPRRRGLALRAGELWRYRELAYLLMWRDLKVRYKQTALGAAWVVLQPLLMMAIFSLVFGRFARIPSDGVPYPVFVYAGLLPWTFFSSAITNASQSLLANTNLVTKVYFPRLVIPASACLSALVDFGIAAVALAALVAVSGVGVSPLRLLLLPPLVGLLFLLALGCGLWLSALKVEYRDFQYVVPFLVQVWLFVTPVIYPVSLLPGRYRWLLALNPVAGIIDAFRAAAVGRDPADWRLLAVSALTTLAVLAGGLLYFRRVERSFADVI